MNKSIKYLKGIDISRMGKHQGCRTLLQIAEVALDISNKSESPLNKIEIVSSDEMLPELYLHYGEEKTTIRYFNDLHTNYSFILSNGNKITREYAKLVGREINKNYPEISIDSAIDLYPELRKTA